jgi:hypothetical protein
MMCVVVSPLESLISKVFCFYIGTIKVGAVEVEIFDKVVQP